MPIVDLTKFMGIPVGSIQFSPMPFPCGRPTCPICYPVQKPTNWAYQTSTKPDTGAVVDFTAEDFAPMDKDAYQRAFFDDQSCDCNDCDECNARPLSNTERVTDLEEEVQNLRAAVLDLTQVVEYLLIWTGKKGNKMDRDKYLDGYIDPIRVIL